MKNDAAAMQEDFAQVEEVMKKHANRFEDVSGRMDFEAFRVAASWVSSRAFYVDAFHGGHPPSQPVATPPSSDRSACRGSDSASTVVGRLVLGYHDVTAAGVSKVIAVNQPRLLPPQHDALAEHKI